MRWPDLFFCISLLLFPGCDGPRGIFSKPHLEIQDFQFQALNQTQGMISLSAQVKEGPVLVVFWAGWCPACREHVPLLNQWQEKFSAQKLKILGVNVQDSTAKIRQFMRENPVRYTLLSDERGEAVAYYQVHELPTMILLAKGGKILYYGFSLPQRMEELLRQGE